MRGVGKGPLWWGVQFGVVVDKDPVLLLPRGLYGCGIGGLENV